MAEIVWTEPALTDLDAIADYIALDDPSAAGALVSHVFQQVAQLAEHPRSGVIISELDDPVYRQIGEPPCRVMYRVDDVKEPVILLHVMRAERRFDPRRL